jgi:serine/threonine-protein kinase
MLAGGVDVLLVRIGDARPGDVRLRVGDHVVGIPVRIRDAEGRLVHVAGHRLRRRDVVAGDLLERVVGQLVLAGGRRAMFGGRHPIEGLPRRGACRQQPKNPCRPAHGEKPCMSRARAPANLARPWHPRRVTVEKDAALAPTMAPTLAEDPASSLRSPATPLTARGSDALISLEMRTSVLPRPHSTAPIVKNVARFEPVRVIGRGGLGEVTLARDHDIDRPVAIKRLRGAPSEEQLMRFAHEVRTIGQLEHPNITPVYDVGVDDTGQHYFVMRYVEGETLEMIISQLASGDPAYLERYSFERRVEIFMGILHAVRYSHAKGIIHRDIKPANIMIGPYGEVMLMDWGIAKQTRAAAPPLPEASEPLDPKLRTTGTRAGALVGTPLYMAPEQASGRNEAIDERSDVYALCVVFYELLALQHYLLPRVANVTELLIAITEAPHPKACDVPSEVQPRVPAELAWYVEKGLAKDPADRYQSVAEMIDALQIVAQGKFPVQCPVTLMKRAGNDAIRLVDKEPMAAMAAVVLVALFAAIGLVATIRWLV